MLLQELSLFASERQGREDGHGPLPEVFEVAPEIWRISTGFAGGVLLHHALQVRAVCRRKRASLDAMALVLGVFHGLRALRSRNQHHRRKTLPASRDPIGSVAPAVCTAHSHTEH